MKRYRLFFSFVSILIISSYLSALAYAGIINYKQPLDRRWKDAQAYRPSPVVFSHGFASGGPLETWVEREKQKESEKPKLDEKLEPYFRNYYYGNVDPITQKPIKALQYSRFPYLELVSYINFSQSKRSQLIDRNSSIDTYKIEDYYVYNYEREPGDPGWADKLNDAVGKIRENYTDSNGYPMKINLVCHSMGGLTAREYITNPKYGNSQDNVKKVIMVGVPNLGSPWASLADGLTAGQKAGWFLPWIGWVCSSAVAGLDKIVEETGMIDVDGDAARDMDASILGSGFLKGLNSRVQPAGVDFYAIWGNNISFKERGTNKRIDQGSGDGVVSRDSQLGTGVLKLKGAVEITASHGTEALEISRLEAMGAGQRENAKPLLKFIDSAKPELKITSPDADKTTEIYENKIIIKGEVSKEYFPADSILKIDIVRQEDGNSEPAIAGKLLYPSDLWVPGDSDSVIAEFEEAVNFAEEGTYKISCEVENPAGMHSDKKEVWVKVVKIPGTNIIVHCYNPEGKEINSIEGIGGNAAIIYDGNSFIGYGASSAQTYNQPIAMSAGEHKIRVTFNGMELFKDVNLAQNQTQELTFIFPRKEITNEELLTIAPQSCKTTKALHMHQDWKCYIVDTENPPGVRNVSKMYALGLAPNITLESEGVQSANINSYSVEATIKTIIMEPPNDRGEFFLWAMILGAGGCIDKEVTIPVENFDKWIVQNNSDRDTEVEILVMQSSVDYKNSYNLIPRPPNQLKGYYCLTVVPAKKQYNYVRIISLVPDMVYKDVCFNVYAPVEKSVSGSRSLFVPGKNLKMSSVPYDLLGTAVGE